YLGDDEDSVISKESRSQALLTKLQQKVQQKQRQSLTKQRECDSLFSVVLRADLSIRYDHIRKGPHDASKITIPSIHCTLFFFPQVKMVLPQWLAEPDVIHRDIKFNLVPISSASGISAQLLRKLETNGIQHFFPGTAEASVGHQPGLFVALLGETTINSEACVMQYDNAAF
ncbi:hypothetical protein GOODEAATRI_011194, partial [Goodea atripinnis]